MAIVSNTFGGAGMEIVSCPSCNTKARVPTDRGIIKVKCPSCTTRYFYPATSEVSEVRFRCSQDGSRFVIATKRNRPDDRFKINLIAPLRASKSREMTAERVARSSEQLQMTRPADQYDWSGFYCPGCGFMPHNEETRFVQCGKCKEFVCGQSVTNDTQTGDKYFRCYPACGADGKLTRSIQEYSGSQRTEANRPEYASVGNEKREQLMGPRSGFPSGPSKR